MQIKTTVVYYYTPIRMDQIGREGGREEGRKEGRTVYYQVD